MALLMMQEQGQLARQRLLLEAHREAKRRCGCETSLRGSFWTGGPASDGRILPAWLAQSRSALAQLFNMQV